jgi:hypothetical protein
LTESSVSEKVKTALDETRLLILGAQVLFGFQLHVVFQELFRLLPLFSRYLECAAQVLMTISVVCLIAPSMLHRISECGNDTPRVQQAATLWAGVALLPFALSNGLDPLSMFSILVDSGVEDGARGIGFPRRGWRKKFERVPKSSGKDEKDRPGRYGEGRAGYDWGPGLGQYRYIYSGNSIGLVEPSSRRVIEVIE